MGGRAGPVVDLDLVVADLDLAEGATAAAARVAATAASRAAVGLRKKKRGVKKVSQKEKNKMSGALRLVSSCIGRERRRAELCGENSEF